MTPEQRIGQLLLVDFDGTAVDAGLRTKISRWGAGGVVFYGRNVRSATQVRRLTQAINSLAGARPHPFIGVDHEGGTVLRLKVGAPLLPGNMAIGATGSPVLARRAGAAVGRGLRTLGFNMNLAPVLDVYSNPSSAIGTRSFGSVPEAVGALGAAFVEGQSSEQVLSVAKHFVPEAMAGGDSHEMTPWVTASASEIAARDLVPELTREGGTPMTFSHRVVTDLLRGEMGFQGLIVTDALGDGGGATRHRRSPSEVDRGLSRMTTLLTGLLCASVRRLLNGVKLDHQLSN